MSVQELSEIETEFSATSRNAEVPKVQDPSKQESGKLYTATYNTIPYCATMSSSTIVVCHNPYSCGNFRLCILIPHSFPRFSKEEHNSWTTHKERDFTLHNLFNFCCIGKYYYCICIAHACTL